MAQRNSHSVMPRTVHGSPSYLGTIVATTTKNNGDTAVPFTGLAGLTCLISVDTACYILPGTSVSSTVTAANGVPLNAGDRVSITFLETEDYLCVLSASGTTNAKIHVLR